MFSRIVVFLAVLAIFGIKTAHADEFGERFHNETPQGLADYTVETTETPAIAFDTDASALDEISPAAGEEAETQATDQQDQTTE